MSTRDVVILSAARTPIGKYGGSLRDIHPAELGAVAARAAIERAALQSSDVNDVWIGHGRQAGSGPNPARQVGHRAGIPHTTPAQTINKACASGLQAIVSAAQSIALGESDVVLAGGIESMSRMPYLIDAIDARWGHRMGNFTLVDAMYRDGFQCPLSNLIMGETAEVLARQYGITREESDCYAFESQKRAKMAIEAGYFTREIAPVTVDVKGKTTVIDRDEHPRGDTTMESLRKLAPVFGRWHHHGRFILGDHRRRRGAGARIGRGGSQARIETARPHRRVGERRRRSENHGHRSRAGHSQAAGAHWPATR